MIYPENIWKDRSFAEQEEQPSDKGLVIPSGQQRMFGYALLPGGKPGQKHPCIVMLHGLPGYTTNHDVAQALRRMGFVVLNPFYRGAWGSEGYYTLTGMLEDTEAAVRWCRGREAAESYGIDPEQVFLLGISMGSWAALHTVSNDPTIRGAILLAPADVAYLAEARMDFFENAYRKYGCLRLKAPDALTREAAEIEDHMGLSRLVPELAGKTLYFLAGKQDTTIPPDAVMKPLWEELCGQKQTAQMRCEWMDTGHSFANCRIELIEKIGSWLAEQLGRS